MRAALCDYTPAVDSYLDLSLKDMMSEVQLSRLQRLDREKLVPRALSLVGTPSNGTSKTKVKGVSLGQNKLMDIVATYPDFAPLPSRLNPTSEGLLHREEADCYYPKVKRTKREEGRPGMMVLTLHPKKEPLIDKHLKDVWDYVLRRMFVMQGSTIEVAIK